MKKYQACILSFLALAVLVSAAYAQVKPDSLKYVSFRTSVKSLPGWAEQKDTYHYFVSRGLYDVIDGGAEEYIKTGLVDGIVMSFDSAGKKTAEVYAEDFGKPGRAQSMMNYKHAKASDPKPVPGSPAAGAFYDEVISGCEVCFYRGKFFFEMSLTGYDKLDLALQDARLFVSTLTGKKKQNAK